MPIYSADISSRPHTTTLHSPAQFSGILAILADGSVRFSGDSTNVQTIWALDAMAQGDVISADSD